MAGLDERDNWSCEGGAHWWHLGLGWGLQLAALQAKRRGDGEAWIKIRQSLENGTYLRDGPALLKEHDPKGMAWTWLQRDPRDREKWPIHTVQTSWLKQPMLLLGGWWDPHLLGLLDLWQQSKAAGGSPKLMVGPATHLEWWPDVQTQLLHFFSQHLKETDNRPSPKRAQFWNITQSCWQESCRPPASTWSLQSSGLACTDPTHGVLQSDGLGMGMEWIVHDPWRPMPAIGGHLSPSAGPADRATLDRRTDVATFNTSPLTKELQLFGCPQLSVTAQADHPGFDLCVSLSRCIEGGDKAEQLSTGVLRVLGNKAQTALEHVVQLQPLLATLEVGDQLRLSIAAAAWPAVGVNPGDDTTPSGAPSPEHRVVTLTLHLTDSKLQLIPMNSGKLASE
jgi:putative CocE/NonD family hydrolase